jgi:phosphate transport system substrate-binding protein
MAAKVGATPFSIGYVGLGFIKEQGLKALALNGVEPNIDNVYNGSYPVQRFLNVVYSGQISGLERAFVDYLLSEDGQNIVEDLDFIPLP